MKKNVSSSPESKSDNFGKMLQRAAGLCSRQEQCTSHIREKLKSWNVNTEDEDQIIQKLTVEKFLDDGRYAGFYAKDKFKFNGWGRIRISHMLRQKNINEEYIKIALSKLTKIIGTRPVSSCFEINPQNLQRMTLLSERAN